MMKEKKCAVCGRTDSVEKVKDRKWREPYHRCTKCGAPWPMSVEDVQRLVKEVEDDSSEDSNQ